MNKEDFFDIPNVNKLTIKYFLVDFVIDHYSYFYNTNRIVAAIDEEDAIKQLKQTDKIVLINNITETTQFEYEQQEETIKKRARWQKILEES